ncbi:MAG: DUF2256 domain-containing protein [Aquiluna sp.]
MPSSRIYSVSNNPKTKNGHPPKVCEVCGKGFEWRKKWERDWETVRYCSERCKASAKAKRRSG